MQLFKKKSSRKILCVVMLPESDQCRSLRTAVADIPSKKLVFTLKKEILVFFFFPVNQVGYIISRSFSVIDNFGLLIEFGRLIAQPYNADSQISSHIIFTKCSLSN